MTNPQSAQHFVSQYERGIVCGGEVFSQYLSHVDENNDDEWMLALTPELLARFETSVEDFDPDPTEYLHATSEDIEQWRHAAALIQAWFQRRISE